ncbi:MAG: hypothetical protein IEMM0008_0622 [bacterium]|nr:MAG: hypothetical protein IEMM0008_0622 [bacterium]
MNLSTTVHPGKDQVLYKGKLIRPPIELSYYILHKPMGYLSSASDPHHRKTIYLLTKEIQARVFHVGRLDKDSEGLLLLTNDGKLAHRLLHPKYQVPKGYYVTDRKNYTTRMRQSQGVKCYTFNGYKLPSNFGRCRGRKSTMSHPLPASPMKGEEKEKFNLQAFKV